ncbi:MAG: transporter substrate-binding domain-containing protein [Alphaproteobacteria bacterium]|nr:transporter substrate-binding domain-containing protein [Alphaproteobacteria bacterium]
MNTRKALFLVVSSLIFLSLPAAAESAACPKKLAIAFFDWKPYHYRGEDGEPTGLDVELLRATFGAAGCDFDLKLMTWKRTLLAIKFGTVDASLGASRLAEREQYAWFSRPYRRETMVMFMRKPDLGSDNIMSLADVVTGEHRIGVLLGSWYGDEFSALYKADPALRKKVLQTPEYEVLFHWLLKDRVDVVFNDLFNGVHILKTMDAMDQIGIHPTALNDDYIHFILSKLTVSEATVDAINESIAAFQRTEDYAKILHKYVPPEQLTFMPMQ